MQELEKSCPKEKILAMRQIVTDLGADRGFLLNAKGYQRGALEAAREANAHLTSLTDLAEACQHDLAMAKVRSIYARVQADRERYWDLPKTVRIDHHLRGDLDPTAYSGDRVIKTIEACAIGAF